MYAGLMGIQVCSSVTSITEAEKEEAAKQKADEEAKKEAAAKKAAKTSGKKMMDTRKGAMMSYLKKK